MMNNDQSIIKYQNPYLTNVIFKLDFKNIENFDKVFAENLMNHLKQDFSLSETDKKMFEYTAQFDGKNKMDSHVESPIYIFYDSELKQKQITIAHNFLAVEFFHYDGFDSFLNIISKVSSAFNELYQENFISRVGLRYLNQITQTKTKLFDWGKLIDKSLIANVNTYFKNNSNIARSVSQTILNYDKYFLNFTYGFFNSDYPAKVAKNEFLLDLDCFAVNIEKTTIINDYIKPFHHEIQKHFENAVKPDLRTLMGQINEQK